jgi:hypothetical protein
MENEQNPPVGKGFVMRPVSISTARPTAGFQLSAETAERVHGIAQENGVTDAALVRLGLVLAEILTMAKRDGNRLAIVDNEGNVVQQISGL